MKTSKYAPNTTCECAMATVINLSVHDRLLQLNVLATVRIFIRHVSCVHGIVRITCTRLYGLS
jgi:hypothetical protein